MSDATDNRFYREKQELPTAEEVSREEKRAKLREAGRWCDKHDVECRQERDCGTCHGDGCIEVDEYGDWHTETCWSCHGSGAGFPECEHCLDEEYDQ